MWTFPIHGSLGLDPDGRPFYEEDWGYISRAIFAQVISTDHEIKKDGILLGKDIALKEIGELTRSEDYSSIYKNYTFILQFELKIIKDFKEEKRADTVFLLEYPADFLLWYKYMTKHPKEGEKAVFMNLERNRLYSDPTNNPGWRFFDEKMADGITEFLNNKGANQSVLTTPEAALPSS
jgi:hypothetical protein